MYLSILKLLNEERQQIQLPNHLHLHFNVYSQKPQQ